MASEPEENGKCDFFFVLVCKEIEIRVSKEALHCHLMNYLMRSSVA